MEKAVFYCFIMFTSWLVLGYFVSAGPDVPPPIKAAENKEKAVAVSEIEKVLLDTDSNATNNKSISHFNGTDTHENRTSSNPTPATTTKETKPLVADLPKKGAGEDEHHYTMNLFFILIVLALCISLTHLLIHMEFHFLPDSISIILLGAFIGLILRLLTKFDLGNWTKEEAFSPTIFFVVLLPPIIFESGYNLHKGNFFQNIGSILVFAVFGTGVSALVVGGGIFLLGKAQVAYQLNVIESFAFGSLISAVDPVATLAIFHAMDIEPVLYMLVFGESVLNDAVSIVLTTTVIESGSPALAHLSSGAVFFQGVGRFLLMFFGSSAIGVMFGLISAVLLKFMDLRKTPSLELGMVLVFSYAPYGLAEGLHLSGIMAILFTGIVMSHYTHQNLSPVTQITVQQTFRTIAYIAETCVFAYLGLAIFSFKHIVKPSFVIWSIVLILIGRALNIFPLSLILNYFREHKITRHNQLIMWFSGLRGAIAFALSLHLEFESEKRHVLVTSTLIIVLFTVIFLGGSTMPMMKCLKADKRKKVRPGKEVLLSKTKEMGETVDSEYLSELTEEEYEVNFVKPQLKGFMKIDVKYLIPFFTRRLTQQELKEGKRQMNNLTDQWYKDVNVQSDSDIAEELEDETTLFTANNNTQNHINIVTED